jgi:TnpA family transposase
MPPPCHVTLAMGRGSLLYVDLRSVLPIRHQGIPATIRDATYVLDEILDNETELPIVEHTTDTAGFTEVIFALFDLLGLQFAPRIRDHGDQRPYRLDRTTRYRYLEPRLKGTVRVRRILAQ